MSIEINVITGRKKALESLLKEVASFVGTSSNNRISAQVYIEMCPKEKKTC